MTEIAATRLPLHQLLQEFEAWRTDPSEERIESLRTALSGLLEAYAVDGVQIVVDAPPLSRLSIGSGSLSESAPARQGKHETTSQLHLGGRPDRIAELRIDGPDSGARMLADALELALNAVWSRAEAGFQGVQLAALDAAVRGIATELSVQRVLQLIVDRVRDLVAAEYAALGIVGPFGNIEQFLTSGLSDEARALIGPVPRGHGLLGLIIREDRSFLIDDIATDSRRHGFPPNHPEMHSFLGAPVRSKGRTIGNLYLTNKSHAATFSDADLRLVEMFALHAGIAMENARLHEEIQRLAVLDERERISRDLHDSIIQGLYGISLSLEDLPEVMSEEPDEGAERAERAIESIHSTIRDIRNFIMGLQPELLEESNVSTGIEALAAEFRANTMIDLEVMLATDLPDLPSEHAAHILAITREGLSNISRHSNATRASIELSSEDGNMRLTIGDNGDGFDPALSRSTEQRGIANLLSRAQAVGGTLVLASEPGAGTRLVADIPMKAER